MNQNIRNRRLHAFYRSKVLNALLIVVIVSLFLMNYTGFVLLPLLCSSLAMLFFLGYSLWLWIKKPKYIVINNRLSNISGAFTLYFLIIGSMKALNHWWYITPIVFAVILLFVSLINKQQDEVFEI